MDTERYLELIEQARDSLHALLKATEESVGPQPGLELLQTACGGLNQALAVVRTGQPTDPDKEWSQQRRAWKAKRAPERAHLLLDALGDDRLTIRELTARLTDALPECRFYESDVRYVVRCLFDAGELDRSAERRCRGNHNGAIRWRYYRFRKALSGPIADLDRAFQAPPAERG